MNKPISVLLGKIKVAELKYSMGRPEGIILICPHCMKSITLGRWKSEDPWNYQNDDVFPQYNDLKISSEEEYYKHIDKCEPILCRGINKIDNNSNPLCHTIVEKLSRWSKVYAKWDLLQVTAKGFLGLDATVIAYVLNNEYGAISFVAYWKKNLDINGKEKEVMVCWDMFTFETFRNKGYATKLLKHSIKDLEIDTGLFPISFPVTKYSCSLVKRISTDKLLLVQGNASHPIKKEKLNPIW